MTPPFASSRLLSTPLNSSPPRLKSVTSAKISRHNPEVLGRPLVSRGVRPSEYTAHHHRSATRRARRGTASEEYQDVTHEVPAGLFRSGAGCWQRSPAGTTCSSWAGGSDFARGWLSRCAGSSTTTCRGTITVRVQQLAHDVLHPRGQRCQTCAEIVAKFLRARFCPKLVYIFRTARPRLMGRRAVRRGEKLRELARPRNRRGGAPQAAVNSQLRKSSLTPSQTTSPNESAT